MYLELWDRPKTRTLLYAFYSDADGAFEFEQHVDVLPEVEAWFRKQALQQLPPMAKADPELLQTKGRVSFPELHSSPTPN